MYALDPSDVESRRTNDSVDNETRHSLKKDNLAEATASSVNWLGEHRPAVVRWVVAAVVVVVLVVAGAVICDLRTSAANKALGAALDLYNTPLAEPGAPLVDGQYNAAAARAKEANRQFVAIAGDYSFTSAATKAHYFAGVTYGELGQTASAESELKEAAGSWNRNLANLAKLALANLYHQTGRDSQAIEIFTALTAKPSETVPAAMAQLSLADLYASAGRQSEAKALWAKIQDADKEGAAGAIAAQKLAGK